MSKLEDLKKKYAVLILTENHGDIAWLLRHALRLERQFNFAAGLISTHAQFDKMHPEEVLKWIEKEVYPEESE